MALVLSSLTELARHGFDAVIDVRSPSEYAEDHLPGAVNLPVLNDAERARVGTIYKQQSPFLARKLGAALVARNAAAHLEGPLSIMGGGWRPLVYCWRGGQRSGSFATILTQVGWRVELLHGGYKSWRRLVVEELQDRDVRAPVVMLDGNTGSAKTEILGLLAQRGTQVIDLEALANHRGSSGTVPAGSQPRRPSRGGGDGACVAGPGRPVVVEAESPASATWCFLKRLWAAMGAAPRIRIAAPVEARPPIFARAYADLTEDRERLDETIALLRPCMRLKWIEAWGALAAAGDFAGLAEDPDAAPLRPALQSPPRQVRRRARRGGGSPLASARGAGRSGRQGSGGGRAPRGLTGWRRTKRLEISLRR